MHAPSGATPAAGSTDSGSSSYGRGGADEDSVNPNEPLYCLCQRISFGNMVGCDNDDCPYEWFHYECVGITSAPDTWYCPDCTQKMKDKKNGRRKRKA